MRLAASGRTRDHKGCSPETLLIGGGDAEWGQDAWRLKAWWDASGQPRMATDYFGELRLSLYGVTSCDLQSCPESSTGYLAVNVQWMTTSVETVGWPAENRLASLYAELLRSEPTAQVGTSIRVYPSSRLLP